MVFPTDLFSGVETPRSTKKQKTRWQTQDEAYLLSSKSMISYVYAVIKNKNHTCDEVEVIMQCTHQSISASINALMKAGKIHDSGVRRLTRSARKAIVWRADWK